MKNLILSILILLFAAPLANAAISVMWIMDAKPVPQVVKDKLAEEGAQWFILRRAAGKVCVDAILPDRDVVDRLKTYLLANDFNPQMVAAWRLDGARDGKKWVNVGTPEAPTWSEQDDPEILDPVVFHEARFLSCMPDECDGEEPPNCVRPTVPREFHRFYGWPDRVVP